jgi:IclR family acetate operon transcriptional repressor
VSDSAVQSVQRALQLASLLADHDSLSLSELAAAAGLAPSTAHRLLATLTSSGYARQDPASRRYAVGYRLIGLSARAQQGIDDLRAAASGPMQELARAHGESAHLTVLDRRDVVFIDQALGGLLVRMDVAAGRRIAAHATASGKALLAWLGPAQLDGLLAGARLARLTEHTITAPDELRDELAMVRRRGWAADVEEQELGVTCIGAPILVPGAPPPGSLSISGPTSRLQPGDLAALGEAVVAAATRVAAQLAPARRALERAAT